MKYRFFSLLFLFFSFGAKSQRMFKVIEAKRSDLYGLKSTNNAASKYFRIVPNIDTARGYATYPIVVSKHIDTLKTIGELLEYEDDKRLCALQIWNYNPAKSKIYLGKDKSYSVQVEALFIINQLVYSNPFNYAAYPILVDRRTNKTYSIDGSAIHKAFQ